MTQEQEDAIHAAYLGLCTLKRCAAKWGTDKEAKDADELLMKLSIAFPDVYNRLMAGILRKASTLTPADRA